jgi:RNA polymerase sigma-32 factor
MRPLNINPDASDDPAIFDHSDLEDWERAAETEAETEAEEAETELHGGNGETEPIQSTLKAATRYKARFLTASEERELIYRWQEQGDQKARSTIVEVFQPLVKKIAKLYSGCGLLFDQLVAEGSFGLLTALDKFDPGKGFRLATYSKPWIKASILDAIRNSQSVVKRRRRRRTKLQDGNQQAGWRWTSEWSSDRDAPLPVEPHDPDSSHNDDDEDCEDRPTHADLSHEKQNDPFERRRRALCRALDTLDEYERRIFEARRLADDPISREELASELGISPEWVCQIEKLAYQKVAAGTVKEVEGGFCRPSTARRPGTGDLRS